jgi:hypothetical protein
MPHSALHLPCEGTKGQWRFYNASLMISIKKKAGSREEEHKQNKCSKKQIANHKRAFLRHHASSFRTRVSINRNPFFVVAASFFVVFPFLLQVRDCTVPVLTNRTCSFVLLYAQTSSSIFGTTESSMILYRIDRKTREECRNSFSLHNAMRLKGQS